MSKSITCPQCGRTSHHPKDIEHQYCGNCHQFHADMNDPKDIILASIALGFVSEPKQIQPTHYQLVAVGGPLRVRWPDGRWFEVTVKEQKHGNAKL